MDLSPLHFEPLVAPVRADGAEPRRGHEALGAAAACAWVARAGERAA